MSLLEDFAKAVERDDSTQIESLLTSGSIGVNSRLPRDGNPPPLVFAAKRKCLAIVEQLLSAGARIDDVDSNGCTACHVAVEARAVDVMSVLLAHQPNLEIKNIFDCTPLQLSLDARVDNMAMMLIDAGASLNGVDQHRLCWFASTSTAAIQALLNRGVVVNQLRGDDDWTPLHLIATRDRWSWSAKLDAVVNMLVNVCGVDVNARTSSGSTSLRFLGSDSSCDAIRCFINAGADVNCLDDAGRPLLHHALYYVDEVPRKRVVMFIAAGANVDASDRRGETAFEALVAKAVPPRWVLSAFMAAGADLSALEPHFTADVTVDQVEEARRGIATARLDFVRHRALQICIGLQSRGLDALQMCEILVHACGPVAPLIAFHQWWKIATAVKHFH